jgi:hypothetical protein
MPIFHNFFSVKSTQALRSGTPEGTMRCVVYDMF